MSDKFITATLRLTSALHIGTGKGGVPTDSPLRRTGDGRLVIPGRALSGSLRTLATRIAPRLGLKTCQAVLAPYQKESKIPCSCEVCALFGNLHPVDPETKQPVTAKASQLWVYDAFLHEQDEQPRTYVRDGVGINRHTRTAKEQIKFNYEVLPADASFQLRLRLSQQTENDAIKMLLIATLAEWEAGRGQLGGNVARGLGRFILEDIAYNEAAFSNADALVDYLLAQDPTTHFNNEENWSTKLLQTARQKRQPAPSGYRDMSIASKFVRVTFDLRFTDLFLTHDPLLGMLSGFDHAPLIVTLPHPNNPHEMMPVLSGSNLRGALRSHGEKIVRTLATHYWYANGDPTYFRTHCPACYVSENTDNNNAILASCDSRLLSITDTDETPEEALCLSCRLFGSQRRGSRLWVRDAHYTASKVTGEDWLAQDFLAIDRFTGGGLHGAKFDAAALQKATFSGEIFLHDPEEWELGWLALLLRDLTNGRLTLGFGSAKGYGNVTTQNVNWTIGTLHKNEFNELSKENSVASGLYDLVTQKGDAVNGLPVGWLSIMNNWVAQFNKKIQMFQAHPALVAAERDSYFETTTATLYEPATTKWEGVS